MSSRWVRVALLAAALTGAAGCVVAPAYPAPVWVPGYWAPSPVGHVWVHGHWVAR